MKEGAPKSTANHLQEDIENQRTIQVNASRPAKRCPRPRSLRRETDPLYCRPSKESVKDPHKGKPNDKLNGTVCQNQAVTWTLSSNENVDHPRIGAVSHTTWRTSSYQRSRTNDRNEHKMSHKRTWARQRPTVAFQKYMRKQILRELKRTRVRRKPLLDAEPSHGAHYVSPPDKKYGADKNLKRTNSRKTSGGRHCHDSNEPE